MSKRRRRLSIRLATRGSVIAFFHQCTTECKLLREVQQLSCIRNRFVACQERMTERITICIRHSCVHITTVRHCGNPRLYVTGQQLNRRKSAGKKKSLQTLFFYIFIFTYFELLFSSIELFVFVFFFIRVYLFSLPDESAGSSLCAERSSFLLFDPSRLV